eukprot:GHVN01073943.1.p1 GENE.GHVN01073943.1~~GHVN01073943.1.p1  ORF type:complete len:588 (-),score=130.21 GHVN01073943.1:175-1938(-)
MVAHPRPKAGVYAVRAGPVVGRNLQNSIRGDVLETHTPQKDYLSLISAGGKYALAQKGWTLQFQGGWVWSFKDQIDRRFMQQFRNLPPMAPKLDPLPDYVTNAFMGDTAASIHRDTSRIQLSNVVGPNSAFTSMTQWLRRASSLGRSPSRQETPLTSHLSLTGATGMTSLDSTFAEVSHEVKHRGENPEGEGRTELQWRVESMIKGMRCGGCGSKVAQGVLSKVLERIAAPSRPECSSCTDGYEDAGIVELKNGEQIIQTIDFFRAFVDDPYLTGQIAAQHALSDCYAMGADPIAAMAVAVVPAGLTSKVEEDLFQLMSGVSESLREANCALIGGHSCEGVEIAMGLAVTGVSGDPPGWMRKGSSEVRCGDAIVLTKPVGIGVLLAAWMNGRCKNRWRGPCFDTMLQSNKQAASIFKKHRVSACTDVTGFGLIGHLNEMVVACRKQMCSVTNEEASLSEKNDKEMVVGVISLSEVPVLDGAVDCFAEGIKSTLHDSNMGYMQDVLFDPLINRSKWASFQTLFDPQTSGGLMGVMNKDAAAVCVEELKSAGYQHSCIIGEVSTVGVYQDSEAHGRRSERAGWPKIHVK